MIHTNDNNSNKKIRNKIDENNLDTQYSICVYGVCWWMVYIYVLVCEHVVYLLVCW